MLDVQVDSARSVRSQVEAWTAELAVLRRDPSVRKFLDLQEKVDQTDASTLQAAAPPWDWMWPYDLYDTFEFARDLAGRRISTRALSRLVHHRFPNLSGADHRMMMQFLGENGVAEVARTPDTGYPASYRFAPLGNGSFGKRLGLPANELTGLKAEDLEDVLGPP